MSAITCTKCGEVSIETSRVVVLPFVCAGCETVNCPCGESLPHQHESDEATSTFDATIALVADLESQLALSKEVTDGQTQIIEGLEKQNAYLAERNDWQRGTLELVTDNLIKSQAEKAEAIEYAKALAFYFGYAVEFAEALEKENEKLKAGLAAIEHVTGIKFLGYATT
jgi:hypothetical protein